jgi:ribonuclease Z
MRMGRKLAWGLGAVVAALLAATWLFGDRILLHAMQRQVVANLSEAGFAQYADGLNIVLCGAGSPMPDPVRAGPCVAVIAGGRIVVIDAGSGAVRNFPAFALPPGRVDALLLTHFHSDHIDGIGELMLQRWAGGARDTPLPVYGPAGVESVVDGFNLAYRHDFDYRVAHHDADVIPPTGAGAQAFAYPLPAEGEGRIVLDDAGLKITAFAVSHAPVEPAVGYRIDYAGRSVVISGDTVKSENLARFAADVDLLVHEALAIHLLDVITAGAREAQAANMAQITIDIHDYHTTPLQAAELAQAVSAKHLLYYHIVPALPLRRLEKLFVQGVSAAYDGPVTVGRDGTWIQLPKGSSDVVLRRRG